MKLKPCPFCGESWVHINKRRYLDTEAFAVTCRTKGCHGVIFSLGYGLFGTVEEAIAAWNTRAASGTRLRENAKRSRAKPRGPTLEEGDAQKGSA